SSSFSCRADSDGNGNGKSNSSGSGNGTSIGTGKGNTTGIGIGNLRWTMLPRYSAQHGKGIGVHVKSPVKLDKICIMGY
ncbi:hypothetical protein A4X03_0g6056, partial [Tilletia caries]